MRRGGPGGGGALRRTRPLLLSSCRWGRVHRRRLKIGRPPPLPGRLVCQRERGPRNYPLHPEFLQELSKRFAGEIKKMLCLEMGVGSEERAASPRFHAAEGERTFSSPHARTCPETPQLRALAAQAASRVGIPGSLGISATPCPASFPALSAYVPEPSAPDTRV